MRPGVTVDIYNKCNACARRMFENRVKLCKEGLETGPDEPKHSFGNTRPTHLFFINRPEEICFLHNNGIKSRGVEIL